MFQEFARQDEIDDSRQNISQELLNLIHNDNLVEQFIDLLYNIKNRSGMDKQTKNIYILNQKNIYNDASNMFQEFSRQENIDHSR